MKVIVSERAKKQLKKITKLKQIIVTSKLQTLSENMGATSEEKLSGYKEMYRIRVGDYRIVYRRTKEELYVVLIGHRKDVYR